MPREVHEVHVLEAGFHGLETIAGMVVGEDANFMQAADQVAGDDIEGAFDLAQFGVARGDFGPDFSAQRFERLGGRAFEQQLAVGDDGHARA